MRDLLGAAGWVVGDPWVTLRRDLAEPVTDLDRRYGVGVEVVGPAQAAEVCDLLRPA